MKQKVKKALAAFLAVVMLFSSISCSVLDAGGTENRPESSQNMYKVEYALPDGTTAEEASKIHLPETEMVEKGTAVNTLSTPAKDHALFLGWYRDPALTEKVDGSSVIDQNLVLYPKFANEDGFEMEMENNYVAMRNVEPSFVIELITDALSEKELEEYIKITNLSKNEPAVFSVSDDPEILPVVLYPEDGEENEETEADVADRENALWDFLERYIGEEELEDAGILREDMPSATVSGFKKALGLQEGDNLEEYLLNELQMDITSALELEELLGMYEDAKAVSEVLTCHYYISAPLGWDAPDLYQAEILDTAHVRFIYDGQPTTEYVTLFNFTVKKAEIENMRLDSGVRFISVSEVQGVDMDTTMYKLIGDDDGNVTQVDSDAQGTLTYSGSESFQTGDVLAVYDGAFDEETKKVDGRVTYVKITGVSGDGQYEYVTAEVPDVVFMPDIIPVLDQGSYGTGSVVLTKEDTDFSDPYFEEMGLDEDTVIEPGDYLAFYRGDLKDEENVMLVGYAVITGVSEHDGSYDVGYKEVTVQQMLTSADLYMVQDNIEIPMTQEEIDALEKDMREDAERNGFFTESAGYLASVIAGEEYAFENSENADVLKQMEFLTDTGEKLTLEEVQLLAGGGRVEVSKPKVQFTVGGKLEYLAADSGVTTGLRGELSATFEITVNMNKNSAGVQNQLKINCTAVLEQEIALGVTISCEVKWGWKSIFYVIKDFEIQLALVAGTYSGLGVTVTIQTAVAENEKEWGDLINTSNQSFTKAGEETGKKATQNLKEIGEKCSAIKDKLDKFGGSGKSVDKDKKKESGAHEASQSVGGSFQEKYSGMLDNDCDWCYLVDKEITKLSFRPDPFQLVEVSLGISFIVKFKLNCMIGFGVSYENVKQLSYTIYVNKGKTESSNADLKTPAFRADFYVFGMAGLRIGFKLDARVGLLSTKIDSIGVVAELGIFFEVYGFLYIHYSWVSGEGESKGIMGSLYFRIGLFLDISFLAQLGDGKLGYSKDLFKIEWPFFEAGAKAFPLGFAEDDTLELKIPKGENKITVPKEFFDIEMMTLTDGETDNVNCDSDEIGSKGDSWTVDGIPFTQYNEKNFIVNVSNRAFTYLPASNTVYVKNPGDALSLETDITFTYVLKTFGFNTEAIERTVHVTWETDPSVVNIEYYTIEKDGTENLRDTRELAGYDGLYYVYTMTKAEFYKYSGYRLFQVEFPDLPEKLDSMEKIKAQLKEIEDSLSKEGVPEEEKASLEAQKCRLAAEYAAAQVVINEYQSNIDRVAKGENGSFTFLLTGKNTKLRFYYYQPDHTVNWYIPTEFRISNSYCSVKTLGTNRGSSILTYKDPLRDFIESIPYEKRDGYELTWKLVNEEVKLNLGDSFRDTKLRTVPVSMPDEDIAVIGYYEPIDYLVTFEDEGEILSSFRVGFGEQIAYTPSMRPALSAVSREYPDGTVNVTFGAVPASLGSGMFGVVMSSETAAKMLTAVLNGDAASHIMGAVLTGSRTVQTDDTTQTSAAAAVKAAKYPVPMAPEKEGLELDYWVIDGTERLKDDSTMPGRDIVITPVYKGKLYTISWVSEGVTVKTEQIPFGTVIKAPELKNAEGTDAVWSVNGQEMIAGMTMPAADITMIASYADHEHHWIQQEDAKAASCTEEGEIRFICDICNETKITTVEKDPSNHLHTKLQNQKAASASEDGYTGDLYCEDCGALLEKGSVIEKAHEHSYGTGVVTKEANCSETGMKLYTCSCGETRSEEIPADPSIHLHTKLMNQKAATASEDGYTGDLYCEDCGKILEEGTVIPHEHNYDAGVVAKDATCKETGTKVYTCGCGATKSEELPVDPLNHVHTKLLDQKTDTSSGDGYTGDLICEDCGTLLEEGTVIPHEHNYDAGVVAKEPTCSETGTKVYTCGCGATKSEELPVDPLNHVHTETRGAIAATLSAPGFSGDIYCTDCDTKLHDGEVTYAPHTVRVGVFSLSFLNDHDYDYYDNTLGYFNSQACYTSGFNYFDNPSPDFPEGVVTNEILVMSGDTIVRGTYYFDEQDLPVSAMTARSYWATFTPEEGFEGVGSFRFEVPFTE